MTKNKPLGIVLIAVYSALSGLLAFGTGALMLFASAIPDIPAWFTLLGVTKWIYIISIPMGIISIFPIYPDSEMTTVNTVFQLFGVGLAAVIIYYVSKPNVVAVYQD